MLNSNACRWWLAPLILFGLLATGCAPAVKERPRFFWPISGQEPKIEYINFYVTEDDAKRGDENYLAEAIFGKERPQPIFKRPHAIASDSQGRVFVADSALGKVFVFDLVRHQVRVLEDESGADQAFKFPAGVAVGADGSVLVCDSNMPAVLVFGPDEKFRYKFGSAHLGRPTGIAIDGAGRVAVVDTGVHRLSLFEMDGTFIKHLGERGFGPGQFNFPLDVAVNKEGDLFVIDALSARVQVLNRAGEFVRSFGERGTAIGSFQLPKSIAISASGHVYVSDSQAHRFVIFDQEGNYLLSVGGRSPIREGGVSPGGFYMPQGLDVDANDTIWIVDGLNRMFHQFQYLNENYLEKHPILPGQVESPGRIRRESTQSDK